MLQAQLQAHSLAEANLYLQAIACPSCGSGPVASVHAEDQPHDKSGAVRRTEVGLCASCGSELCVVFQIPPASEVADPTTINPTDEPSRIIDLGQWITLAHVFAERAAKSADPRHARRLNLQAAQCVTEALKFYDDPDNDLPPPDAFFCELSRERFRTHPQQFSRQRLLHERSKLPTTSDRGGGRNEARQK
jgi:hypothetical protein